MNIRKLFELKKRPENPISPDDNVSNKDQGDSHTTYRIKGVANCRDASGNELILKHYLEENYEKYKKDCQINLQEQDRLKRPYKERISKLESEIRKSETLLDIKQETLKNQKETSQKCRDEIEDIPKNPSRYGIDATRKPQVQFYLGLIILLPVTLYLVVFYMSASYSAFFKPFDINDNFINSIFDPNALKKAWGDGWLEFLFISTIPFAFMGLGYLVHMFLKSRTWISWTKIIALILVTFIFDGILAYQIEKKIYEYNKKLTDPPFDLGVALTSIEFWGIIFAGFVVYMIWGLILDFVLKEFEDIDKVKKAIKSAKERLLFSMEEEQKLENLIAELRKALTELVGQKREQEEFIAGWIISKTEFKLYHTEYLAGWFSAIGRDIALPHDKQNELINRCEEVNKNFLLKNELDDDQSQIQHGLVA